MQEPGTIIAWNGRRAAASALPGRARIAPRARFRYNPGHEAGQ